jgi:hypothetical protein
MSVYGGPEINDSGLVLALDAANTKSAPASTTWTDLSGNANNGTLTNGPVYIFGRSAISCTGSAGNRLEIAHTTALNLNGSAYTIECWVYPTTSFATYVTLLGKQSLFTAGYSLWVNSGYPAFGLNGGYNSITSSTILTLNNWHHIAVVSDGSTYTRLFLNGVQVGTSATLLTTSTTSLLTINGNKGGTNWDTDYPFRGLISDVRIVKSTAVYTGAFTRPSAPLTAIANTQLLTCNDPVIKDSSPNTLTISTVGTVAVDNTTVSNVLFDGTDDYAALANSGLVDLGNDYTLSAFIKLTNTSQAYAVIFSSLDVALNTNTKGVGFYWYKTAEYGMGANSLRLQQGTSAWSWNAYASDANSIADTNWHFVSLTVSNASTANPTVTFSVDGVAKITTFWNASSKAAANYGSSTSAIRLGSAYAAGSPSYIAVGSSAVNAAISTANVMIFKRALSSAETLSIFNALRGRYGL